MTASSPPPTVPSSTRSLPSLHGLRGAALLRDPRYNRGGAFTEAERDAYGLRGLLHGRVSTLENQVARIMRNVRIKPNPLEQYIFLAELQDRNQTLFYRALVDHVAELMPVVYTPTVGTACRHFMHIYTRPRGLYIGAEDAGRVEALLRNWPEEAVKVIVVTDGERILGLGDLGANGMGIPIGKLALYAACGGVHPDACLPVMLDVGTDNPEIREDPLYIGLPRPRLRGAAYEALLDEFVTAAERVFPGVLIQFEDFATDNAFGLLDRYRDQVCCFNDDIQGTAAVALAGLIAAGRLTGRPLDDQRLLFLGAGAAATGIAELVVLALRKCGLSEAAARGRCYFVDSTGLVTADRANLAPHKRPFAHPVPPAADLLSAVEQLRPTALLGLSAQAGAFTEPVLRAMAEGTERPIVFALSNPTSKAECRAAEAYAWTEGRAVFASGSPFDPVTLPDGRRFRPGQGNNAYIFPGLGLGVLASGARRVSEAMFLAAAESLAEMPTGADLSEGSLYPPLEAIRDVSAAIGRAVAEVAWDQGLATLSRPEDPAAWVRGLMYQPRYEPLEVQP